MRKFSNGLRPTSTLWCDAVPVLDAETGPLLRPDTLKAVVTPEAAVGAVCVVVVGTGDRAVLGGAQLGAAAN